MTQGREFHTIRISPYFGASLPLVNFKMSFDRSDPADNYMATFLENGQCYEPEVAAAIMRILQPGDSAIDVGANNGFFTVMMSQCVGKTGRVYAYEPHPETFKVLTEHTRINDCKNTVLAELVVSDRHGEVDFYLNSDMASSSALIDPGLVPDNVVSREHPRKTRIPSVLLTNCEGKPIKLVKIDTEGAEHLVLKGAEQLLMTQHPPFIIVELNPFGLKHTGSSIAALRQYMLKFGYALFLLHPNGAIPTCIPSSTEVRCVNDIVVANAMFSSLAAVSSVWTKVYANSNAPPP